MSKLFKNVLIVAAVSTLIVFGLCAWYDGWQTGLFAACIFYVFLWGFPIIFLAAEEDYR